jgi:hypothetical protein
VQRLCVLQPTEAIRAASQNSKTAIPPILSSQGIANSSFLRFLLLKILPVVSCISCFSWFVMFAPSENTLFIPVHPYFRFFCPFVLLVVIHFGPALFRNRSHSDGRADDVSRGGAGIRSLSLEPVSKLRGVLRRGILAAAKAARPEYPRRGL